MFTAAANRPWVAERHRWAPGWPWSPLPLSCACHPATLLGFPAPCSLLAPSGRLTLPSPLAVCLPGLPFMFPLGSTQSSGWQHRLEPVWEVRSCPLLCDLSPLCKLPWLQFPHRRDGITTAAMPLQGWGLRAKLTQLSCLHRQAPANSSCC